jgi:hypothetical protein
MLYDDRGRAVGTEAAGLLEAEVARGRSVDLTIVLPVVHQPGRYRLLVDLVDERQCSFFQVGSEPLEQELEFR